MASIPESKELTAYAWQQVVQADQTKNPAVIHYAVLNYLRCNPSSDCADLEDLLRRHQCFTYLMPYLPKVQGLGKAEWPPGHEKRYHLYVYLDSPENRRNLVHFVTPASKEEQKHKLRDCGLSYSHLRDSSFAVPLSFVEVLQDCLMKCQPVKEYYLNDDAPKKAIPFGEPFHSEFKTVQELFDQGFLYFPILALDGALKGVWTAPRKEIVEGIERLGSEHAILKETLLDFVSSPEAFFHEFCFFQFFDGAIRLDSSVRQFVFGMFEDSLKLLECKGLISVNFNVDLG